MLKRSISLRTVLNQIEKSLKYEKKKEQLAISQQLVGTEVKEVYTYLI